MEIERLLKLENNDIDKLCMILSNNVDRGCSDGGLISVKNFKKCAEDILKWREFENEKYNLSKNDKENL